MKKWLRKMLPYLIGAVTAMAISAVVLTSLNIVNGKKVEVQSAQTAFFTQYGNSVKLIAQGKQDVIWIFVREDATKRYVSAIIGGVWVELGNVSIISEPVPAPTP